MINPSIHKPNVQIPVQSLSTRNNVETNRLWGTVLEVIQLDIANAGGRVGDWGAILTREGGDGVCVARFNHSFAKVGSNCWCGVVGCTGIGNAREKSEI